MAVNVYSRTLRDVEGVLFDLDGTLIDTYETILVSMRYAVNDVLGKDLPDSELMRLVGTPLLDQLIHFADGDEQRGRELMDAYRVHNAAVHDAMVRSFPGTAEALARMRDAGLKLGIVTSKRHETAERGARIGGVLRFFDLLIGPDDWPEHKPAPGPVLRGCELLDVSPARCLYVGDSPYDLRAGNAAGCISVAALWGMFSADELVAEHPAIMCASLGELTDALLAGR
ncbi:MULTISPECIES: HAD family hydrolase [unclassified Adlercreutzia]|uniref:HAD family hydrolase n=1 Tax=unclassified Adlercreutzia TaxID=2636013 RepID=UPI001F150348|nr:MULTISPECIES: HAD-IA family hydrolase [unclassified Adlercreutzia]